MNTASDFRNRNKVVLNYDIDHDNAENPTHVVFTDEAHLQSQYPDHEYINRDNFNEHSISICLKNNNEATLDAFKARIFISLDGLVWFHWVEMTEANITIVDLPASFIKIVRDNSTAGTISSVILSKTLAIQ